MLSLVSPLTLFTRKDHNRPLTMTAPLDEQSIPSSLTLTLESTSRNITRLAVPAVAENLLVTLVFIVDTLIVARLKDPAALVAVSLGGLFLHVADQLLWAISMAASALVAHAWGARDYERARRVAGQSILIAVLFASLSTALLFPLSRELLKLMGASDRAVALGAAYMRTILVSSVLGFPLVVLNGAMRGAGDAQTPMLITLVMNVWNVVVATALVFGAGPLPALGLSGAALATASARMLGGLLALALLISGKRFLHIHRRDILRSDRKLMAHIIRLSLPTAAESIIIRMGFITFVRIVSSLGEVALAAHQIAVNVESLSFMPGHGLSVASTTLVGQSLGADKPELAEASIHTSLRFSFLVMGTIAVVFALFGPSLVAPFGSTAEVLKLAGRAVRIGSLEQLPIAALMVIGGSLRGAGDMRTPVYANLAGTLLFRVPFVYLFAIIFGWGLDGVWLATAVDWTARATLIYLLFRRGTWKRIRL